MEALEVRGTEVAVRGAEGVWERPKYVERFRVRTRIGAKGRLVIPAAMREALKIAEGDMLDLVVVDGELRIATMRERLRRAQERVRQVIPPGVSLADELSAERREAAKHE
jgi:AbrB family looped-hinge helix DNA binding protein